MKKIEEEEEENFNMTLEKAMRIANEHREVENSEVITALTYLADKILKAFNDGEIWRDGDDNLRHVSKFYGIEKI